MGEERGVSQVYLAFDPDKSVGRAEVERLIGRITDSFSGRSAIDPKEPPAYPGMRTLERRRLWRERGVELDAELWDRILALDRGDAAEGSPS